MIITRLTGGLGNQMFQYAIARSCQRDSEKIILDTRLLQELEVDIEKIIQRPLALNVFKNLKADIINHKLIKILDGSGRFDRLKRKLFEYNTAYVVQSGMAPIKLPALNKKNIFLIGNFQSEVYFESIGEELLHDFCFPGLDEKNENVKRTILNTDNSLSLHIRRGDYNSSSNKNIFTSVNLDYYKNAIDVLKSKSGIDNLDIFLFTDDFNWAKDNVNFKNLNINMVDNDNYGENSWKDMYLMSCCKHHVIANSSFSWWGAWLSKSTGVNLAPKHWYLPESNFFSVEEIVPKSWITIDYAL